MSGHILKMLRRQAKQKHLSFHTPGHKKRGMDITELSYSDNLSSPVGVIKAAEEAITKTLRSARSFILTDGSTSGVLSMLYAFKAWGGKKLAVSPYSHKSIKNGCKLMGLEIVPIGVSYGAYPHQPSVEAVKSALKEADGVMLTSPDYYGFLPDLKGIKALCDEQKKPLLIDGAHGSHLHFTENYAGEYATLWVDGAHKSLPTLTQGAVVSASSGAWVGFLAEGVDVFRTTSPSYPIMASVEEGVLFPRNEKIEREANRLKSSVVGALKNDDWSKLVVPFGSLSSEAERWLEDRGVYPEFNDGNYLMFYFSPCTKKRELKKLERLLTKLTRGKVTEDRDVVPMPENGGVEKVPIQEATGRICAKECGVFPPCVPLFVVGERMTAEKLKRLTVAYSTFGVEDGYVSVFREEV